MPPLADVLRSHQYRWQRAFLQPAQCPSAVMVCKAFFERHNNVGGGLIGQLFREGGGMELPDCFILASDIFDTLLNFNTN